MLNRTAFPFLLLSTKASPSAFPKIIAHQVSSFSTSLNKSNNLTSGKSECPHLQQNSPSVPLKTYDEMPGPKGWPLLGNVIELAKHANNPNKLFADLAIQYGDFVKVKLMNQKMVILSDPKIVRELARCEEGRITLLASRYYKQQTGKILITMDMYNDENWNDIRQVLNVPLKPQYVSEVVIPQLTELNGEFLRSLENNFQFDEKSNQYYINDPMIDVTSQYAFASVIKAFLGVKLTEKELIEKLGFSVRDYVRDALESTDIILKLQNLPPLYKYFETNDYKKFKELSDISFDRGNKIVELLVDRYDRRIPRLKELIQERANETNLPPETTVTCLSAFLLGGVDVTARMMTTLLYRIAHEKEWAQKMYDETVQVFGEPTLEEFTSEKGLYITAENVKQLKACKAFIDELFRRNSVIPVRNMRVLTKDTTLGPYHLEKGTQVIFLDIPHVQSKYVPRGMEFIPERHFKGSEFSEPKEYLGPFGTGARKCPGERVATTEIYFSLISVIRHFKLNHSNGDQFPEFSVEKTFYYIDPTKYRVFFTPRDHLTSHFAK